MNRLSDTQLQLFLQRAAIAKDVNVCSKYNQFNLQTNPLTATQKEIDEIALVVERPPRGMKIYKYGSRSLVGIFQLSTGKEVVLKYYFPKSLLKHLHHSLNGSRARISWISGLGLSYLGFPTPRPIAYCNNYTGGGLLNSHSFLATEKAEGITLYELPSERYSAISDQLSEAFSILDSYRIVHGDLKASNLVISDDNRVSFIDLDATKFLVSERRWPAARKKDRDCFLNYWTGPAPW